MYSENDLDELITQSITESDLPKIEIFRQTTEGFRRIMMRVKQHILVRGIADVDACLALVETELSETESN